MMKQILKTGVEIVDNLRHCNEPMNQNPILNFRGEEGAPPTDANVQEARHALHEHEDDGAHAVRIPQRLHTVPGMES